MSEGGGGYSLDSDTRNQLAAPNYSGTVGGAQVISNGSSGGLDRYTPMQIALYGGFAVALAWLALKAFKG